MRRGTDPRRTPPGVRPATQVRQATVAGYVGHRGGHLEPGEGPEAGSGHARPLCMSGAGRPRPGHGGSCRRRSSAARHRREGSTHPVDPPAAARTTRARASRRPGGASGGSCRGSGCGSRVRSIMPADPWCSTASASTPWVGDHARARAGAHRPEARGPRGASRRLPFVDAGLPRPVASSCSARATRPPHGTAPTMAGPSVASTPATTSTCSPNRGMSRTTPVHLPASLRPPEGGGRCDRVTDHPQSRSADLEPLQCRVLALLAGVLRDLAIRRVP